MLAAATDAAKAGSAVVPLFVLDPTLLSSLTGPRRDYLFSSLAALEADIQQAGGTGLLLREGAPNRVVAQVAAEHGATKVFVTGDYSPYSRTRDRRAALSLATVGSTLQVVDSPCLHRPGVIRQGEGKPYSVFTPYYRNWVRRPIPAPAHGPFVQFAAVEASRVPPKVSTGEHNPLSALEDFIASGVAEYGSRRNRPDLLGTSQLGAALHFGELHPRTILAAIQDSGVAGPEFIRQLCWRDFYADVLFHNPAAAWSNVDRRFDAFPWRDEGTEGDFDAWCHGRTGFPFVDAGMRQLLETGWMHNRTRMVTASFLVKDLLIDWRRGARWFLRHLTDADIANNNLGWQWAAGTGTDAAPFFRIFNPVLQGQRFDPNGAYVRRYVPELGNMEGSNTHQPWNHPNGYALGYPQRMLDHKLARSEALAAYQVAKESHLDQVQ